MPLPVTIHRLERLEPDDLEQLAEVLVDCVQGGASVSFMWPFTHDQARAFWQSLAASVARGGRLVLVARDAGQRIVGTVQLVLDLPPNQPHRADVAKMLVHRSARRGGLGARLLEAAEQHARAAGRSLLVLDTVTGGDAERLYAQQGWQRCGVIPDYALWPDGRPCSTTLFYKPLAPVSGNQAPA